MPDHPALRWEIRLPLRLTATRIFTISSKAIKCTAALLCLHVVIPAHGLANTEIDIPPLLETARAIECAVDSGAAEKALNHLKLNSTPITNIPNEWFGIDRQPTLHAGTFDIVINVVLDSISKHPANTDLAESVLLGWNYCAIHHNGKYFDQFVSDDPATRHQALYQSPTQWHGLQRLGVSRTAKQRYIPAAFNRTNQSTRPQVVYDWWAIQRNQCLPHPATGELFYKKTLFGPSKVIAKQSVKNNDYPYPWTNDCSAPYTVEEHKIHEIKLAAIVAERETRIRLEAAHALHIANTLEIQSKRQRARMPATLSKDQTRRLQQHAANLAKVRKDTTEDRTRYTQASAHAKNVVITTLAEIARGKTREELRRRTEAFELRQRLKQEATVKEDAAIAEAELALQLKEEEQLTPRQTVKQQTEVAVKNSTADMAQPKIEIPNRPPVITIVSAPEDTPEAWNRPAPVTVVSIIAELPVKSERKTDQRQLPEFSPQVVYNEEPLLASAIDGTEQNTGKNLQSTPPQTNSTAFPSGSVPPFVDEKRSFKDRKYHGFSGSFALSNRRFESTSDAWSFTANFGYKPIRSSYFFARSGFTFIDSTDGEPVSYYWGIGYNDWHTDTWAFELNHWGPLKPGDGLQLEKAVASISYKFDSELLKNNGLSSSFSVSGGENAAPTATLAGSWTPKPNWFIRTLITQPLEGGDTTWAYGFGYSDWREKTWALEYNNWGPNKVFDLNFRDNALVTLSWKWGF